MLRVTHHQTSRLINCKLLFCTTQHKNNVGFNLSNHNKHILYRPIFVSKQELVELDERKSPNEVKEEINQCYELINRLGRGVVYLGAGPGLMDAVTQGALLAGKPVGGWTASNFHPYLPSENYLTSR
ncbi:hypothetical protein P8452_25304 [Trifolium repens]|nr:hypothetical protein P8452_25304 [Trifolium repens]